MHFIVERSRLLPAVKAASQITEKKSDNIPIMQTLLLAVEGKKLSIVGADLLLEVQNTIIADVTEEGSTAVNSKAFYSLISGAGDGSQIEIICDGKVMEVRYGKFSAKVNVLNADDFPVLPQTKAENEIALPSKTLHVMLEQTCFAIDPNDARIYLTGAHLSNIEGNIVCTCTDGHRLAQAAHNLGSPTNFEAVIIPHKTVNFLLFLLKALNHTEIDCGILISDRSIEIRIGDTLIRSKLIDADYPNIEPLFNGVKGLSEFNFDSKAAIAAINRVSSVDIDRDKKTSFNFEADLITMHLRSAALGSAEDVIPCENVSGKNIKIGFNSQYFKDICDKVPDTANIKLDDAGSGALITPLQQEHESIQLRYLVMPVSASTQSR